MGNVHSFAHRLTVLSMAFLSSAALIFCALGGFSCSFVQIRAKPDRNVMTWEGEVFDTDVAFLGVQCEDTPFYSDSDRLWNLSQLFLYISLGCGGLTALMAWTMTLIIPPTGCRWRSMSIMAAITAVMQIPIFLIFESDNCNFDINRQTCRPAYGAYLNILSVVIWVVMTIWIQCLKAPMWAEELDAWKVESQSRSSVSSKDRGSPKSYYSTESGETDEELSPRRNMQDSTGRCYDSSGSPNLMESESNPEILWASMQPIDEENQRNRARVLPELDNTDSDVSNREQYPSNKASPEEIEEQAIRNASCMERILQRNKKNSKTNCNAIACPAATSNKSTVMEDDVLQGAAATVMDSLRHQSDSACAQVDFSVAGQTHDAVCVSTQNKGRSTRGSQSQSRGSTQSRSTSSVTVSNHNDCCPETLLIERAVTSCMMMAYDDGEEKKLIRSIPGIPDSFHMDIEDRKPRRGKHAEDEGDSSNKGVDENENETGQVDFLLRRMQSDQAAAASARIKSKVAPLDTIEIDTSVVDGSEEDHADEVSEMTRGSGLASGVSEVLDSDTRHQNHDTFTILDDLARTY